MITSFPYDTFLFKVVAIFTSYVGLMFQLLWLVRINTQSSVFALQWSSHPDLLFFFSLDVFSFRAVRPLKEDNR